VLLITVKYSSVGSNSDNIELSEDVKCLADNIYHEARNESTAGKIAVGLVVINRKNHPAWPQSVCNVIRQGPIYKAASGNYYPIKHKCQFSWYCDGKKDVVNNPTLYFKIIEISQTLLAEEYVDFTDGATHYHADYVNPSWSYKLDKTAVIDTHIFYK